jgi:hypothetical protein
VAQALIRQGWLAADFEGLSFRNRQSQHHPDLVVTELPGLSAFLDRSWEIEVEFE